jgi:predicted dehydrogenase
MPPRTRNRLPNRQNNIQRLLQGGLLTPLRVAAVGVGWLSQNRHLPAICRRPEYQLVGVIDADPARAHEVANEYGVLHAQADDLAGIGWLDTVDALIIGAPAPSHAALIEQALACNKHILTEKPFVTSIAEGERLASLARRAGRVLAVMDNFQFTHAFACLQCDMVSGRLGDIFSVMSVQFSNPRRRPPAWIETLPGGQFFDESPHLLYLARRLLPGVELEDAKVIASDGATPQEVRTQLRNFRGQGVKIVMRFDAPVSEWHMTLQSEHGRASLDMYRDRYLFIQGTMHDLREGLPRTVQAMHSPLWGSLTQAHPRLGFGYDEVFARFAAAVRSGTLQPEHIGSSEALAVLRLQQEILSAAGHHSGSRQSTTRTRHSGPESMPLPMVSAHLH